MYSYNEYNNWIFGYNTYITFNTKDGNPISIKESAINTLEGCSSISDNSGNLLFYTDGNQIYDRNNSPLLKDTTLMSHTSSTQSALIIKKPGNNTNYYIFTVDAGEYYKNDNTGKYHNHRGLYYSELAIDKDTLIDILYINKKLADSISEKLTAVNHSNQYDIWVVAHDWNSNGFQSFLITENGISLTFRQNIGYKIGPNWKETIGYMKFSPRGNLLAFVSEGSDYISLFKFDNKSANISEPMIIPTQNRFYNYGVEFSSNSQFLYISEVKDNKIYKYDLSEYNVDFIKSSEELIYQETDKNIRLGALQIAPNFNIYFTRYKDNYLGVIENPDSINSIVNHKGLHFDMPNSYCGYGLPNMNQSNFIFSFKLSDTIICQNSDLELKPSINSDFDQINYLWKGPNNFQLSSKDLNLPNISLNDTGLYYLEARFRDYYYIDSAFISVIEAPNAKIEGINYICNNEPIVLKSKYNVSNHRIRWSTGEKTDSIIVRNTGVYYLEIINGICSSIDSIEIKSSTIDANLNIQSITDKLCIGDKNQRDLSFINFSEDEIEVKSIYSINLENIKYNFKNLPITLKKQEHLDFTISFQSDVLTKIIDTLYIEIENQDCLLIVKYPIEITYILKNNISIDNYKQKPNDTIDISIKINNSCTQSYSFKSKYKCDFVYNSDYFILQNIENGKILKKQRNQKENIITIESDIIEFGLAPKEVKLNGLVSIGNTEISPIQIFNLQWSSPYVYSEITDGAIEIESCNKEMRQVNFYEPTNLEIKQIDDKLEIYLNTQVIGEHKIQIFDLQGKLIEEKTINNSSTTRKDYIFRANSKFLPNKIYFVVLYNKFIRKSHTFLYIN